MLRSQSILLPVEESKPVLENRVVAVCQYRESINGKLISEFRRLLY